MTRTVPVALLLACVACGGSPFAYGTSAPAEEPGPDAGATEGGADAVPEAAGDAGRDAGTDAPEPREAAVDGGEGGVLEASADAPAPICLTTLSGVGDGDFTVSFTLATTMRPAAPGYGAILDQRLSCDSQHSGWAVWLTPSGTISVQIYDGSNVFDDVATAIAVNDGAEHAVRVERRGSGATLRVVTDGTAQDFTGQAPMMLGTMAPLQTGADPLCMGNSAQPSETFVGLIDSVCLTTP